MSDAAGPATPGGLELISDHDIDASAVEAAVLTDQDGALVTFRGIVRNHDHGASVSALDYQAHPDAARFMAEACETIARETGVRVVAVHRVGALVVGDTALVAAAAAAHRHEAFEACERLVDLIKKTVPIWKRQHLAEGATEWVGL
ncbi:molybdenum cofactor biosynthesis protein MoaE [Labedella endophytica]|uniref:Molybdenum cofactor biosynthesis protein MoaE n=1 Tax=Labedella endophytica TaxID=1523160 RepID=A0A3S0VG57_9MICO|nr:molybdenum cofactor biosynthesis protein MoaE [Labedella endophytica]RUR00933.1 molybdenum cofactor biosynthesis protein MoaE [Labedella endophytica]